MKIKSIYNVFNKDIQVAVYRNVVDKESVVDIDFVYNGPLKEISDVDNNLWTDEVDIDPVEKCLMIRVKDITTEELLKNQVASSEE